MFDLAYVAGFFDGEGWVGITRVKKKDKRGSFEYRPTIRISNTNDKVLHVLKSQFGGSIQRYPMQHCKNAKDMYVWTLQHHTAGNFIRTIQPFLFLKKEQAKVFLEYMEKYKTRKSAWPRLTDEDLRFRESAWRRLKELNHRGREAPELKL